MNINDYQDDLRCEEQRVLDCVINEINQGLDRFSGKLNAARADVRRAILAYNPDEYTSLLLDQERKRNANGEIENIRQAKKELYHYRLLLECQDIDGSERIVLNVGLHQCVIDGKQIITSWKNPICRYYLEDNSLVQFQNDYANYTLLVKNEIKLNSENVQSARNLLPMIFDAQKLNSLRGVGFFSQEFLDQMIAQCDSNEYDRDKIARIIYDAFLRELLARRTAPDFKNIVFSIQKKQGEIIQAPLDSNIIVQGCAGSGKSMIMLHRLPILLYDNSSYLSKEKLYVITPSQMYIQLAENMRHQLEISDINIGTIEEYYEYCIDKYPGYRTNDYGKINYNANIDSKVEQYVFSAQCIADIKNYYDELSENNASSLRKAYSVLAIKEENQDAENTYFRRITSRLLKLQQVIRANEKVLSSYFSEIRNVIEALNRISNRLKNRKADILKEIERIIAQSKGGLEKAKLELEKLDPTQNAVAVKNRNNIIEVETKKIDTLKQEKESIEAETAFFDSLLNMSDKLNAVLSLFGAVKKEFYQNSTDDLYAIIENAGSLIGAYYALTWELAKVDVKYSPYLGAVENDVDNVEQAVNQLRNITDKYLDISYYKEIQIENTRLSDFSENAVKQAYRLALQKSGYADNRNRSAHAIKYSPYLYLQAIYLFKGPSTGSKELLLAIDEAQSLAPEEIRLLKNINGDNVKMNLFGDIYQHIEGTKGIDSWDEVESIIEFDRYEIQENYRNASQITEYCNSVLEMNMDAINLPGRGVHEISSDRDIIGIVTDHSSIPSTGLCAILFSDDNEVKWLKSKYSAYEHDLNYMTSRDSKLESTKWNVININDAKGLEFNTVIAISGKMSHNQKYIAFTRALDSLYVYSKPLLKC